LAWDERNTFTPAAQGEHIAGQLNARSLTRVPNASHRRQDDAPVAVLATPELSRQGSKKAP